VANPSELEGVVLGIVHAQQPCTPYAIRRELFDSPSTYWSASAGSIYPLIKRLVGNGWLEATPDKTDRRGRQVLRLTRAGKNALRSWTTGGADPEIAARMYDSLRVRMFSLGALRPAERRRFAKKALAALEESLANTQRHLESRAAEASEFEHLANLGGVHEAEARVAWMREVVATLG
jgi:DNA-binding PadR family transcriptional regulator